MILGIDAEYLETGQPSGSTAAMCVVRPPPPGKAGGKYSLHVINAGDSRVLLSHADGTIVDGGGTDGGLSTDHKPDHPSERERIERCGGTVQEAAGGVHRVNGDLAVSRGFGDAEYKKTGGPSAEDRPVTACPEMGHFECGGSDFVLIVCDGVSEGAGFPNGEVCREAARVLGETGGDAAKAAEAVCLRALACDSKDNISCMIVLLGGVGTTGAPVASSAAVASGNARAGSAPFEFGRGMTREFSPGSLLTIDHKAYQQAYLAMCERGGVTLATAAEQRYEMLVGRQGTAAEEEEDEEELAKIGAPEGGTGSAERRAWFEGWATQCQERTNQPNDDDDGDGLGGLGGAGGSAEAMERMAMMRMLLGMMQEKRAGNMGP